MSVIIVLILRALFALSLFAFLGWVIYVLWKDQQKAIKTSLEYKIPSITLKVNKTDLEHSFSQPEFFIGRDAQTDMHIPDDTLSAVHARVFYKNSHWMIEDLQSTNGTFINDERLSTPSVLVDGDQITCGEISILVAFGNT